MSRLMAAPFPEGVIPKPRAFTSGERDLAWSTKDLRDPREILRSAWENGCAQDDGSKAT